MQGYYFSPPVAAESWTPSYERFLAHKGEQMVREQLQ
jgi:hypothetical protein